MSNLSFPLYHATSSLFIDSIKKYGLGGKNIIQELHVIDLLVSLEALADKYLMDNEEWEYIPKLTVSYITNQRILASSNFQHGEVYFTPSIFTARRYAKNEYGSEAITITFQVIDLLNKLKVPISDELLKKYSRLLKLKNKDCEPVIYRIKNLPLEYLGSGERKEDLQDMIERIEECIREEGIDNYEGFVQQDNFRVAKPIPWDIVIR